MAKIRTATRTISNSGQRRTLVSISTEKAVGFMPTESLVEYDGLIELIADKDVVSIQVQPETFSIEVDGDFVQYTPDVKFQRRNGRLGFREFKDSTAASDPEVRRKLNAFERYFCAQGFEFQVRTSDELRTGHKIANLKLLKRYASWATSDATKGVVLNMVESQREIRLHELRMRMDSKHLGALYRMIWDGQLNADLEGAPLSGETVVRLCKS